MQETTCTVSDVDLAKLCSASSSRHASTDRMGTVRNGARVSKQEQLLKSISHLDTGGGPGVT